MRKPLKLFRTISPAQRYSLKNFSGNYIRFYAGCDDDTLLRFIKQLLQARNEYLRKFTVLAPYRSYEGRYSNLQILHCEGVIRTEEYTQKLIELNSFFAQTMLRQ